MKSIARFAVALLALVALIAAGVLLLRGGEEEPGARLLAAEPEIEGFARVEGPPGFDFPADHGPHPAYQTEWWYYTGNLTAADGRHFGYQLTFFRRALRPADDVAERQSDWAATQVYMAHFALVDVQSRDYVSFERFSRGAAGLAGAQSPPFRVWLEDWSVVQAADGTHHVLATANGVAIDLMLTDLKGPALQGDEGYSQKGEDPGNASAYYSLTRLQTQGEVRVGGASFTVEGLSWMDHEYSTSALSRGQVGWDWFSIQLDDGSEFMLFTLRTDGGVDPYSHGLYVEADASAATLHHRDGDYTIDALDTWRSAGTGAEYPARWRVVIPERGVEVEIEPWLADQEFEGSYSYWEGAVRVSGERNGEPITGSGYVELTGYAGSMEGEF